MPGTIRGAVAKGAFPVTLSTKFTESHAVQLNWNEYQGGETQRASLVTRSRRSWRLSKRLAAGEFSTLESFWSSNPGTAFYFYNPFETDPPSSRNPTGDAGRYLVRFTSDWQPSFGMVRADVACELIEVGSDADITGTVIVPPLPRTTTITAATLGMTTSFQVVNNTNVQGVIASVHLGAGGNEFFESSTDYASSSQLIILSPTEIQSLLASGTYSASVRVDNPIGGFQPSGVGPAVAQIYDIYLDVTDADGVTQRVRPTSTRMINQGSGFGAITNAGNAIDGDPSTFATLTRTSFDALDFYNTFTLQFSGIR